MSPIRVCFFTFLVFGITTQIAAYGCKNKRFSRPKSDWGEVFSGIYAKKNANCASGKIDEKALGEIIKIFGDIFTTIAALSGTFDAGITDRNDTVVTDKKGELHEKVIDAGITERNDTAVTDKKGELHEKVIDVGVTDTKGELHEKVIDVGVTDTKDAGVTDTKDELLDGVMGKLYKEVMNELNENGEVFKLFGGIFTTIAALSGTFDTVVTDKKDELHENIIDAGVTDTKDELHEKIIDAGVTDTKDELHEKIIDAGVTDTKEEL